jgi:hypothetical protein
MCTNRILRLTLTVLAAIYLLAGPAQAGSITDTENRLVIVPDHPQRVLLGRLHEGASCDDRSCS